MFQEEMEIVFMVVFTTEMLTKILALGFMLHKGSYMRNPWNFMDFFVVTSGWANFPFFAAEYAKLLFLRFFSYYGPTILQLEWILWKFLIFPNLSCYVAELGPCGHPESCRAQKRLLRFFLSCFSFVKFLRTFFTLSLHPNLWLYMLKKKNNFNFHLSVPLWCSCRLKALWPPKVISSSQTNPGCNISLWLFYSCYAFHFYIFYLYSTFYSIFYKPNKYGLYKLQSI